MTNPSSHRPVDRTHDPALRSWVATANAEDSDFPIQNLPFGVFRRHDAQAPRIGVAIGDQILDLARCLDAKLLEGLSAASCDAVAATQLNPLMALGPVELSRLRGRLAEILGTEGPGANESLLVPMNQAELQLPAAIREFTDFYASLHHATNVGRLFRPDNPLLPNYKHIPIAYHGRSSSIVVAGTGVRRPSGQIKRADAALPAFGPSQRLDYEAEIGLFVGPGNRLGEPVALEEAERHLFGVCLLNDWSARDVQAWEYQPLGPFLSKNFATTISPWIVTLEALAPFRAPAFARAASDPKPLPYLVSPENDAAGAMDITLEVFLQSSRMRAEGVPPQRISRSSARDLYWTPAQMFAHHTSNGCNLNTGDLLGTGTVSGSQDDSAGCLLELTRQGAQPLTLPTGETRQFLADGDEVIFRGYCRRDGFRRIGFGECRGIVVNP
jgi:fumarylacetoacetase